MDEDQFSELYERLRRLIYWYAATRVSDQNALDVVHDSFEVVWRKRNEAPQDPDEQSRWCFGIARFKVLQQQQRGLRRPHEYRFADGTDASITPEVEQDVADRVTEADAGRQVWSMLSASDRELAVILVTTDWSASEIAAAHGVTYSAHTSRVARLRGRILKLRAAYVSLEGSPR